MRIERCILLICGFLFLGLGGAQAQTGSAKTPTQLNNEVNTLFPDQNQGAITPFDARQTLLDLIASGFFSNPAPVVRPRLTAPTNFFVDTTGNDGNSCLASGSSNACATIQGALNKIYSLDANGQPIGISCAASQVFTGAINLFGPVLSPSFPTPLTLNCNNSTINVTGSNAIEVGQGANLLIINTVLQTTSSGNCLEAYQNGQIFIGAGVIFAGCAGFDMEGFAQGYFDEIGNYSVTAGSGGHYHLTTGTVLNSAGITITLTGTPAWSNWFLGCSQSSATFFGVTFAGSGTGQRYLVHKACSIDTGLNPASAQPETYFPGSTVGVVDASSAYLPYKAPTALSCGTSPAVASTATDWSGVVTVGTGSPTTCDILFNSAKTTAPNCTVVNDGQVALTGFSYISNNTGIAISFGAASGATLHWTCTPTGL
jgi:hypothetical protein